MDAIKIISIIFVVLIVTKLTAIVLFRKQFTKWALTLVNKTNTLKTIYLVIGTITGYYMIQRIHPLAIATVMLFMACYYGYTLLCYEKPTKEFMKNILKQPNLLSQTWLSTIVIILITIIVIKAL